MCAYNDIGASETTLTSRQEKLEVTIGKLKCNFKFQKSQETTLADIVRISLLKLY